MRTSIFFLATLCTISVQAQHIGHDNRVIFQYKADHATKVEINIGSHGIREEMSQDGNGLWTYQTDSLPSDLYTYEYLVDGIPAPDTKGLHKMRDIDNWFNYLIIPNGRGDYYAANAETAHGTIEQVWYTTQDGRERRMSVYLPASYGKSGRSYPVLYLLHGSGGDELAWIELGRATQIMDNLIARGEAEEMIVVMPNGNMWQDASPTYYDKKVKLSHRDVRLSGSFEMQFPDIVQYIETNYHTIPDKQHRAIAGLSMGGYHSMHISHHYPNLFDYVGLFSPAYCTTKYYKDQQLFPQGEHMPVIYQQVEVELKEQFGQGLALYWIAIGKDDFLYEENMLYRDLLEREGYVHEFHLTEGAHTWRNWREYLLMFVPRLFQ